MSFDTGNRVWVDPYDVGRWRKGKVISPIESDSYLVKFGPNGMFKETIRGRCMITRKVWWTR